MGPTGMAPEWFREQVLGGKSLMGAPVNTPEPAYEKPMGLLGHLGKGAEALFSDPATLAPLQLALNSMSLRPNPGIAQAANNQLLLSQRQKQQAAQQQAQGNRTVEALAAMGVDPRLLEQAKGNPQLLNALVKRAFEKPDKPSAFAEKVQAIRAANPKMSEQDIVDRALSAGSNRTTIDLSENKMGEEYAKQIPQGLAAYVDRGVSATRQTAGLNRLEQMLEGQDTGGFEETKMMLRSFGDRLGLPVDEKALADAAGIQAVARQLVAEELRQNKGPQTDFDAQFAQTYMGGLGQQSEANRQIISYMRSRNRIDSILGSAASGRSYEFEGDKNLFTNLNQIATTTPSVAQVNGAWRTFDQFYGKARARGLADMEILEMWRTEVMR